MKRRPQIVVNVVELPVANANDFFATCERDEGGRCVAGEGGAPPPPADKLLEAKQARVEAAKSKAIETARDVRVTDDVIAEDPSVGRRDYQEIERSLQPSERREMEEYIREQVDDYVDRSMEMDFDTGVNEREVARDNDLDRESVMDEINNLIHDHIPEGDLRDKCENAVDEEVSSNTYGDAAVGQAKTVLEAIEGVPKELIEAVSRYEGEVEATLRDKVQEAEDESRAAMEKDLRRNYDDTEDREEWLRNFYDENEERFTSDGVSPNTWAKEGDGDGDHYLKFSTEDENEYTVRVVHENEWTVGDPKTAVSVPVDQAMFEDEKGSFQVTGKAGAGEAREVMTKVAAALVAYAQAKNPPIVWFTAAEPSRQKLYDRLAKTLTTILPQYSAMTAVTSDGPKHYAVVHRDIRDEVKRVVHERTGFEPTVIVNVGGVPYPFFDPDWFLTPVLTTNEYHGYYPTTNAPPRKRSVNPLALDPSRTLTLRKTFTARVRRQFALLKGELYRLLVIDDAFGMKERHHDVKSLTGNALLLDDLRTVDVDTLISRAVALSTAAMEERLGVNFDPDQPRNPDGTWGEGGAATKTFDPYDMLGKTEAGPPEVYTGESGEQTITITPTAADPVKVRVNPSASMITAMARGRGKDSGLRGMMDDRGNVYVFPDNIYHAEALEHLKGVKSDSRTRFEAHFNRDTQRAEVRTYSTDPTGTRGLLDWGRKAGIVVHNRRHMANFDPDQPRDSDGKFSSGGGPATSTAVDYGNRVLDFAKSLPGKLVDRVKTQVKAKYGRLEARYGKGYARAIIGAALVGLPIPAPGASFVSASVLIGLAELHRMARGGPKIATANEEFYEHPAMTEDEVQAEAARLVEELTAEFADVRGSVDGPHTLSNDRVVWDGVGNLSAADVDRAAQDADPDPTERQRESGNYAKGHVNVQGLHIAIETAAGNKRKPWHDNPLAHHYGYIKRHVSEADGDHVDVFLGPDPESDAVFVVDQLRRTVDNPKSGYTFDEHKVMLGWHDEEEAKAAYLVNYSDDWDGFGGITELTIDQFKRWLREGDTSQPIRGQNLTANYDEDQPRDEEGQWLKEGGIADGRPKFRPDYGAVKDAPDGMRLSKKKGLKIGIKVSGQYTDIYDRTSKLVSGTVVGFVPNKGFAKSQGSDGDVVIRDKKDSSIYYFVAEKNVRTVGRPLTTNRQFNKPENYDKIRDLPDGNELWAGANDWENGWTWAWVQEQTGKHDVAPEPLRWMEVDHKKCPACKGDPDSVYSDRLKSKQCRDWAKKQVGDWAGVMIPTTNTGRWAFESDPDKLRKFREWLAKQLDRYLRGKTERQLWEEFARQGFTKGAGRAFEDVNGKKRTGFGDDDWQRKMDFYAGTKEQFLKSSFGRPETAEKLQLLAQRSFDDLENVTDDMAVRMQRTLIDGLSQGKHPELIAKDLDDDLDVGRNRAEVIARTEIIRCHAEGQLNAMEALGVEEVGVMVEFATAGDDRVCPRCQALEGVVLKIDEAHNIIPVHPQCRCAFLPANLGEDPEDQVRGKRAIDRAFREANELGADLDVEVSVDRPRSLVKNVDVEEWAREQAVNAYCPMGEGGGIDNTCSPFTGLDRTSKPLRGSGKRDDPYEVGDDDGLAFDLVREGQHVRVKDRRTATRVLDRVARQANNSHFFSECERDEHGWCISHMEYDDSPDEPSKMSDGKVVGVGDQARLSPEYGRQVYTRDDKYLPPGSRFTVTEIKRGQGFVRERGHPMRGQQITHVVGRTDEGKTVETYLHEISANAFDPDQARDEGGRWTSGGGGSVAESPQFKDWFSGSKVVDENGEPKAMYHSGTFDENDSPIIRIGEQGMHFGTQRVAEDRVGGKPIDDFILDATVDEVDGRWGWSSGPHESFEEFDTEEEARADLERTAQEMDHGQDINETSMTEVYLVIKNPKRMNDQRDDWTQAVKQAKAQGYDGIVYRNQFEDEGRDSWIAFYPRQIKSVNNRGGFDRDSSDVLNQNVTDNESFFATCDRDEGGRCLPGAGGGGGRSWPAPAPKGGPNSKVVALAKTPEFKKWFGQSKVVDEDGNPAEQYPPTVVYHGTPKGQIEAFDKAFIANPDAQHYGPGFYFTEDPEAAQMFAKGGHSETSKGEKPTVMSFLLKAENPFDVDHDVIDPAKLSGEHRAVIRSALVQKAFTEYGRDEAKDEGAAFDRGDRKMPYRELTDAAGRGGYGVSKTAVAEHLKSLGHDSLTTLAPDYGDKGRNRYWIVFEPTQIKSTENKGAFDPSDPSTLNESFFSTCERDEHGWCTAGGGGSPRKLTDDQVRLIVRHQQALMGIRGGFGGGDLPKIDLSTMTPGDRLAIISNSLELYNNPEQQVWFSKEKYDYSSSKNPESYYSKWKVFEETAKKEEWSGEKILEEGFSRGLFRKEPFPGSEGGYKLGNTTPINQETMLKGMSLAQKQEFAIGYASLPGKISLGPGLKDFHDAGWSTEEREMFADKLQEKGWSFSQWVSDGRKDADGKSVYDQRDATAGELAFYSKDYDNFRGKLYSNWALVSGSQSAITAREIVSSLWPCKPPVGGCYELESGNHVVKDAYSQRAVENMKALKKETEEFYRTKLKTNDLKSKTLELMRAVRGHPESYVPGSVESWTRDKNTVPRFGKMMASRDGHWSSLKTTITYDDILWSYESAKGKPGWPEEKELKGKKEFVTLGRSVKEIQVEHNTESKRR